MQRYLAVVAHFDPDDVLDPSFDAVLEALELVCDRILVVSTCQLSHQSFANRPKLELLVRPNFGYDFYSYRVGVTEILRQEEEFTGLFILNSSFLISDRAKFVATLHAMRGRASSDAFVGLVGSHQWAKHVQSYLLLLRHDIIVTPWFQTWLSSIEPHDSKLEVILTGELGLTRAALDHGVRPVVLYRPTLHAAMLSYIKWARYLLHTEKIRKLLRRDLLGVLRGFNPSQFCGPEISRHFGLIKTELLRDNPHNLSLDTLRRTISRRELDIITKFLARTRKNYHHTDGGLTQIRKSDVAGMPTCRTIYSGPVARPGVKVAVIAHIFYPELLEEIRRYLTNILVPFDLIVTTPYESLVPILIDGFADLATSTVVAVCENRGRDVGPFVSVYRLGLLRPYTAVLKLHSKKSTYSENGSRWRTDLYNGLTGSPAIVRSTLELFERNPHIGIIGPHANFLTNPHFWGADKARASELLVACGALTEGQDPELGFFAGSMFWFRPSALSPLHAIPLDLLNFEPEKGQQDGTLAHAFERIFCNVINHCRMIGSSVELNGLDIRTETKMNMQRRVPVLPTSLPNQEIED